MSVYGRGARGGHAVVEIMAGIGRACPRLRWAETNSQCSKMFTFISCTTGDSYTSLQNPEPIGGVFPQSGVPHLPLLQGRSDFNMPYKTRHPGITIPLADHPQMTSTLRGDGGWPKKRERRRLRGFSSIVQRKMGEWSTISKLLWTIDCMNFACC